MINKHVKEICMFELLPCIFIHEIDVLYCTEQCKFREHYRRNGTISLEHIISVCSTKCAPDIRPIRFLMIKPDIRHFQYPVSDDKAGYPAFPVFGF